MTSREQPRQGQYRKPGALYMVGCLGGFVGNCDALPRAFGVHTGKGSLGAFTRGFSRLDNAFFSRQECWRPACPIHAGGQQLQTPAMPLLWIGQATYPTADQFLLEAQQKGICRPIPYVPKDFQIGVTHLALAHARVWNLDSRKVGAAVFMILKPDRIDYILRGDEPEGKLARLRARGISLVQVERAGVQIPLPLGL